MPRDLATNFERAVSEADGEAVDYSDAETWLPRHMKRRDANAAGTGNMYLVTKSGSLLGVCQNQKDGWRFLPNTTSRKACRAARKSAVSCIPKWAFDISDELLTLDEWKKRAA